MPTVTHGSLTFDDIRNNFAGYVNSEGFNWGTNNANLYNLNYYRGRNYTRNLQNSYFPSGTISFNPWFYNADGNCACACSTDTE